MLRLAQFLREGDYRSVAGHFVVFDPLGRSDEGSVEHRAIMLLDGFGAIFDQSFHAFALLAFGTFAKLSQRWSLGAERGLSSVRGVPRIRRAVLLKSRL